MLEGWTRYGIKFGEAIAPGDMVILDSKWGLLRRAVAGSDSAGFRVPPDATISQGVIFFPPCR